MTSAARRHLAAAAALAATLAAASATAQTSTTLYKSTGPDGRTVYSDRPVPSARQATTLTYTTGPSTALPASVQAQVDALKSAGDTRTKAPAGSGVQLFSASWCSHCRKAKSHLSERRVAFREFDIDTPDGKIAFTQAGGQGAIPLLVVDGKAVTGYSAAAYDAALGPRR